MSANLIDLEQRIIELEKAVGTLAEGVLAVARSQTSGFEDLKTRITACTTYTNVEAEHPSRSSSPASSFLMYG